MGGASNFRPITFSNDNSIGNNFNRNRFLGSSGGNIGFGNNNIWNAGSNGGNNVRDRNNLRIGATGSGTGFDSRSGNFRPDRFNLGSSINDVLGSRGSGTFNSGSDSRFNTRTESGRFDNTGGFTRGSGASNDRFGGSGSFSGSFSGTRGSGISGGLGNNLGGDFGSRGSSGSAFNRFGGSSSSSSFSPAGSSSGISFTSGGSSGSGSTNSGGNFGSRSNSFNSGGFRNDRFGGTSGIGLRSGTIENRFSGIGSTNSRFSGNNNRLFGGTGGSAGGFTNSDLEGSSNERLFQVTLGASNRLSPPIEGGMKLPAWQISCMLFLQLVGNFNCIIISMHGNYKFGIIIQKNCYIICLRVIYGQLLNYST